MDNVGAITIDVDSTACYHHIHGLDISHQEKDPIYEIALPRFLDAMAELNLKATLFVIGRDLENPKHQDIIAAAAAAGHEIASHSYAHDYALSRLPTEKIQEDIRQAHVLIQNTTGSSPVGFRAPGYNQSEALFDAIEDLGYTYDSSFFPTPTYFAARATAIALYQIRQRQSRSLIGDVREFLAPRTPFFPDRNCRFKPAKDATCARKLIEIPISVASFARIPWLGTTLTLAPDSMGQLMTRSVLKKTTPAILELHAIDFADGHDGFTQALVNAQNDLNVPIHDKTRRLKSTFEQMAQQRQIIPMKSIAQSLKTSLQDSFAYVPQAQAI